MGAPPRRSLFWALAGVCAAALYLVSLELQGKDDQGHNISAPRTWEALGSFATASQLGVAILTAVDRVRNSDSGTVECWSEVSDLGNRVVAKEAVLSTVHRGRLGVYRSEFLLEAYPQLKSAILREGFRFRTNCSSRRGSAWQSHWASVHHLEDNLQDNARVTRPKSCRIAVVSDTHSSRVFTGPILSRIEETSPRALFHLGDVSDRNTVQGWIAFFRRVGALTQPLTQASTQRPSPLLFFARGNHDLDYSDPDRQSVVDWLMPPRRGTSRALRYSVRMCGVRWWVMDGVAPNYDEQLNWLGREAAFLRTGGGEIGITNVAFIHVPVHIDTHWIRRGSWPNVPRAEAARIRERHASTLRKLGFKLSVSGHDHKYQRGVTRHGLSIISGGGGGVFMPPVVQWDRVETTIEKHHYLDLLVRGVPGEEASLQVTAIGADGSVLDSAIA